MSHPHSNNSSTLQGKKKKRKFRMSYEGGAPFLRYKTPPRLRRNRVPSYANATTPKQNPQFCMNKGNFPPLPSPGPQRQMSKFKTKHFCNKNETELANDLVIETQQFLINTLKNVNNILEGQYEDYLPPNFNSNVHVPPQHVAIDIDLRAIASQHALGFHDSLVNHIYQNYNQKVRSEILVNFAMDTEFWGNISKNFVHNAHFFTNFMD